MACFNLEFMLKTPDLIITEQIITNTQAFMLILAIRMQKEDRLDKLKRYIRVMSDERWNTSHVWIAPRLREIVYHCLIPCLERVPVAVLPAFLEFMVNLFKHNS